MTETNNTHNWILAHAFIAEVLELKLLDSRLVTRTNNVFSVVIVLQVAGVFYSESEMLKHSHGYIR